ncbi:TraR/DksA C4-type zinc finger protein [Candidatus Roizmanbacteria bacterium]|nr:TraR/DksA C4-type zinc finger protein [Candidatus Roizmanbacteria bacterium]
MANQLTIKLEKKLAEVLQKEAKKLQKQIGELKQSDPFADPDHALDNAAVDTDVREQVGHHTIEAEVKALQRKLTDVELALQKMQKGKYGICERCGKPIPVARLKILPEARFDIECEQKLRK